MNSMQNEICIYRGSHQIGGCAMEISTGNHRIVIDFGANLPDNEDVTSTPGATSRNAP